MAITKGKLPEGVFVPEIWSEQIMDTFINKPKYMKEPVLKIGGARITILDIDLAINSPETPPGIRDALVAFRTKLRLLG